MSIVFSYTIRHWASTFTGSLELLQLMTSAPSTALPSDLSKLNVSQLKAICKERRIVGYSKLGKAALICKLAELAPRAPPSISTQKTSSNTETGSIFHFLRVRFVPC